MKTHSIRERQNESDKILFNRITRFSQWNLKSYKIQKSFDLIFLRVLTGLNDGFSINYGRLDGFLGELSRKQAHDSSYRGSHLIIGWPTFSIGSWVRTSDEWTLPWKLKFHFWKTMSEQLKENSIWINKIILFVYLEQSIYSKLKMTVRK